MPKGGWRPNSGRPTKAQAAEKARLLAETIKHGPKTLPRQYLQGLLDSSGSTKSEKLRAAELLLKLPSEAPAASIPPPSPPVILSIPRGCFLSKEQRDDPEQLTQHGTPIEPFVATKDWTKTHLADQRDQRAEPECERFEVAEAEVPANVTRMDTFVRKRDSDDEQGPPAGAA